MISINNFAILLAIGCTCFYVVAAHEGHDHGALVAPIFESHEVVPDVIDVAPHAEVRVRYENGVSVHFGDILTPTQVQNIPTVEWTAEPESFYTLIMTDPDAPSRRAPVNREIIHWRVVNIPGNNVTAGDTLTEYVGAGPSPGSDLHRYIFFVFKQSDVHDFEEPITKNNNPNRSGFSTRKFAEKHHLGKAIAGNLFRAEYDDYVPNLYKQF